MTAARTPAPHAALAEPRADTPGATDVLSAQADFTTQADLAGAAPACAPAPFAIGEHDFLLHGEPFRVLSGALHYFRVHPGHWADRIRKARQMGLNTIETYVAWNAHAPRPGVFDLTGPLDLGRFLDLVAAEGMHAIVRPGPYICAEWTGGGLPVWLLAEPGVGVRRDEPQFMAAIEQYLHALAPVVIPRQIDRGGPVILMQVENEYGAYGKDKAYLRRLVELYREIGVTVPLTTVDQPLDDMLEHGSLPGLHMTASFGSRADERLDTLRRHQPTGPLMCSEFWDGWFDDWGGHHHTTPPADTARELDTLLRRGASVNIYMFHGGTNFGFTSGANDKGTYQPITTSYDYDAPLDEAGNPTAKYWAFREVLARYGDLGPDDAPPAVPAPAPVFRVGLDAVLPLWPVLDRLGEWGSHRGLPTADALGQHEGFTLYRTRIEPDGDGAARVFEVGEVRDRAQVFLDRRAVAVLARDHRDRALPLPADAGGDLELLVEDLGRVDYGRRIGEPKGLIGPATLAGVELTGWEALALDLSDIEPVARALREVSGISSQHPAVAGPAFARARFDLPEPRDLFLDTAHWGKGVVWVNGFCLGRYWSRGPQRTLYVPGPVLRPQGNELIVFELHAAHRAVQFAAGHDLGHTEH
jgi:beta-galactosidase